MNNSINRADTPLLDQVFNSSLTLLLVFAIAGWGLWHFLRGKLGLWFFAGFGVGALYLLWVNSASNRPDKVYSGSADDLAATQASGGLVGLGILDALRKLNGKTP